MFDKVVVITDRVVLDRQLQETIYQFEHARGVVVKIDENSQQLADALVGEQARIIITTLQKFPFVLDKIGGLPAGRYAVIVDEAHSSQTGEAAKELRAVLGGDEGGFGGSGGGGIGEGGGCSGQAPEPLVLRPPRFIRCDNGPELVSAALQDWCRFNATTTAYMEPGAPWQNPYAESFNGHLRRELLDMESFNTLHEAQLLVEDWRLECTTTTDPTNPSTTKHPRSTLAA